MSRGATFVRFYPSDWRSGCIGLSFEQEGLYVRICAYIYETRKRIPASDSAAARILGANTNAYVKVRKQLCELGLLTMRDGEWTVSRAEVELAKVDAARTETEVERRADPRPERETSQDAIAVTARDAAHDTPPAQAKKTQSFLRANKEPRTKSQEKIPPTPKGAPSPLDALKAFEEWNATALRCAIPQASKMTPDRQRRILARLKDYGSEGWSQALANIERSSFLTGKNDRSWTATLDFLLQPASFSKVHDGTYGNGRHGGSTATGSVTLKPHEIEMQREADELRRMGII